MSREKVEEKLQEIVSLMGQVGEVRDSQRQMALFVYDEALTKGHAVVEAGTGSGKTIAYLLPLILQKRSHDSSNPDPADIHPVVVSTYTKALQDQMIGQDLPTISQVVSGLNFGVLKGVSNYLCLDRLDSCEDPQIELDLGVSRNKSKELIQKIRLWSEETPTGDRAELPFPVNDLSWGEVSVSSNDCLSRDCKYHPRNPAFTGEICFSIKARAEAAKKDVIVTNHAYYAATTAVGVFIPHKHVVFDEAHEIENAFSSALSIQLTSGRFDWLSRNSKALLTLEEIKLSADVADAGKKFKEALEELDQDANGLVHTNEAAGIRQSLELAEPRIEKLRHKISQNKELDSQAAVRRVKKAADSLLEDIRQVKMSLDLSENTESVTWTEGSGKRKVLISARISIKEWLKEMVWEPVSFALATSATIPTNLQERLALDGSNEIYKSPFNYEERMLYYSPGLPSPRENEEEWGEKAREEIIELIRASNGGALILFSSRKKMKEAYDYAKEKLGSEYLLLGQGISGAANLIKKKFIEDGNACLFATRMFMQGIDVPGSPLRLVIIDRIPFPGPNEYLVKAWSAQSNAETGSGWGNVEFPLGLLRTKQAVGRLIRKKNDFGVVAILDSRAFNKGSHFAEKFKRSLPSASITSDFNQVKNFYNRFAAQNEEGLGVMSLAEGVRKIAPGLDENQRRELEELVRRFSSKGNKNGE